MSKVVGALPFTANENTNAVEGVIGPDGVERKIVNRKLPETICTLMHCGPSFYDSTPATRTHNTMMTAPGHFDAVAVIEFNIGASTTIDAMSVAVSERSDTSKTIPTINGTQYNALAGGTNQLGWIPITWDGGSTAVTLAIGTPSAPTVKMSDWIPISSIPRADGGSLPLVMFRKYWNTRNANTCAFATAADLDQFGTLFAPHEYYNRDQGAIDGVTVPANFTNVWTAGGNGTNARIFGVAFRMRGTSETVMFIGDSIIAGLGSGGDTSTRNAKNAGAGGWVCKTGIALANVNKPVGYMNCGIGGQASSLYLARAKVLMAAIRPTIAVYPVYTPNDSMNTSSWAAEFNRALDFVDTCRGIGVTPVLVAPVPYGSAVESERMAIVNKIKAMRQISVIDPNVAGVYDASNAAGFYWASGATIDNTHPSDAGYTAIANLAAIPVLRALTSQT